MNGATALLLIDPQVNMFDEASPVEGAADLLPRLKRLLERARAAGVHVVFVQNCGGPGDPDEPGSVGWDLHAGLAPRPGEAVVHKTRPDGFEGTLLRGELERRGVGRLVVAGMQSEACVSATCRRAAALGFEVTLVSDGHSTYDGTGVTAGEIRARVNGDLAAIARLVPAREVEFP